MYKLAKNLFFCNVELAVEELVWHIKWDEKWEMIFSLNPNYCNGICLILEKLFEQYGEKLTCQVEIIREIFVEIPQNI